MGKFIMSQYLEELRGRLEPLAQEKQIAFALWCCERLYPSFAQYVAELDRPDELRPILDQLWRHAAGDAVDTRQGQDILRRLEGIPLPDQPTRRESLAVDAVAAAAAIARGVVDDLTENIVVAAECAIDQADREIWVELFGPSSSPMGGELRERAQAKVDGHPRFQRELAAQRDQVEYLKRAKRLKAEDRTLLFPRS
jgi:hypothetical protein